MSELNKAEVYDAINNPFWEEVKTLLGEEVNQAKQDIIDLDFSQPESNFDAIRYQGIIDGIKKVFEIVDEIKESAKE